MTAHDHTKVVPGCYRCELSADEMNPAFDWPRPRSEEEWAILAWSAGNPEKEES